MTTGTKLLLTFALLAAIAAPARAQIAQAEVLFREAKQLMKDGNYAEACQKFAASEKLDAKTGTELNLGNCYEKTHKTASAWAMFLEAAASAKRAGDTAREREASKRAAALESQLVYLTIRVAPDRRAPGLTITSNDQPIDPSLWGVRTPVDPDAYAIVASADGYQSWSATADVKARDQLVEVPPLARAADAGAARGAAVASSASAQGASSPAESSPPLRRAPLVLGAAGVVAIGAGIALGAYSHSQESSANSACPASTCAIASAVTESRHAHDAAIAADVGFGVGGAAIAAAIVWLVVAGPHASPDRVTLVPTLGEGGGDAAGIAAVGRF